MIVKALSILTLLATVADSASIGNGRSKRSTSLTRAACEASSTCFDYIIVGGGTAGLAVASRLSEDSTKTVLVIEAGIDYEANATIAADVNTPADAADLVGANNACESPIDWCFTTTVQEGLNNRTLQYARGKTLGGSSARNLMVYHRPTVGSMDLWAALNLDDSYSWDNMFQYYLKSTVFTPPNDTYRPITNPPTTYEESSVTPVGSGMAATYANYVVNVNNIQGDGMVAYGLDNIVDHLSGNLSGVAWTTGQMTANATRSTSRSSYLANAEGRSNLHVLTSTMAQQITFSGTTATGVIATSADGVSTTYTARLEVILSAGTFQSPQLLMVSGIGPKSELEKFGITQIVDNENVGAGMQDHVMFAVAYQVNIDTNSQLSNPDETFLLEQLADYAANGTGLFSSFGGDRLGFERFSAETYLEIEAPLLDLYPSDWPTVEYLPTAGYAANFSGIAEAVAPEPYPAEYASTIGVILQPTSRGTVTLASNSMNDLPIINPNWISTESDEAVLVQILKDIRAIWNTAPLANITISEVSPGANVTSYDDILNFIKNNAMTVWHACSTLAMLPEFLGGVVNTDFQVYGTSNLRVVDASVFPFLPPGHPTSTIYAIAEKAADTIKAAHPADS